MRLRDGEVEDNLDGRVGENSINRAGEKSEFVGAGLGCRRIGVG